MILTIIIFFLSTILVFGMLFFRVSRNRKLENINEKNKPVSLPEIPFRHLEKSMLYLTKRILLGLVLVFAKYWFILITKIKRFFNEKWPKVNSYFTKKPESSVPYRHSFVKKAILESKAKIKRIKEKVKEDIE